jgi:hypothetical protein
MRLTAVDLEDDDYFTLNNRDSLKYRLTPSDAKLSMSIPGVIKFDYIDLDKTEYNFKQFFEQSEVQFFFERMKLLSSTSMDELKDKARDLHLFRSDIRGKLRETVAKIYPEMLRSNPIIYHIALHDTTHSEFGNRKNGTRCPRLYFMLGTNGHIYILFFDPFHELNPGEKQT